jgi:hypothetical protein
MITTLLSIAPLFVAQVPSDALRGYADVLENHVKDGKVAYKKLAEHDLPKLDAFLKAVAEVKPPADKDAQLALYIDAYNALVLRAVIDEKVPRSVLDVKGFFDTKTYPVAGKKVTLNQLEKEVIIPLAKPDPRPHMALVCAAVGCPILFDTPYSGASLDARLDAAARRYFASPRGAKAGTGTLQLSKIFDWYKADFGGDAGVIAFAKKYLSAEDAKKIGAEPKISYLDYNWTLNQQ